MEICINADIAKFNKRKKELEEAITILRNQINEMNYENRRDQRYLAKYKKQNPDLFRPIKKIKQAAKGIPKGPWRG